MKTENQHRETQIPVHRNLNTAEAKEDALTNMEKCEKPLPAACQNNNILDVRCLLFDLDGTLTDSAPGILHSVQYALEKFSMHLPEETLNRFIGPPLRESFRRYAGMNHTEAECAVKWYRECFVGQGAMFENTVYDGIEAALQALRSRGVPLAVATAKPEVYAIQILDRFGLTTFFEQIHGATLDGTVDTKTQVIQNAIQALPYRSFLMLGDREQDITGAHFCGIPAYGVLWGYGSVQELMSAGADRLLQVPQELQVL